MALAFWYHRAAPAMEATIEETIGYEFRRPRLLQLALTHPSYKCRFPGSGDYQRLEFLGDAVIGLIAANLAYTVLANKPEGKLTVARAGLVNNAALYRVGCKLGFREAIRFGDSVGNGKCKSAITDVTEAIIGAVFADGGYVAAKHVFDTHYAPILLAKTKHSAKVYDNPKSALQERIQKKYKSIPWYTTNRQKGGSDHAPTFRSTVEFADSTLGAGTGRNKREAEAAAARNALKKLDKAAKAAAPEPLVPSDYAEVDPKNLLSEW